MRNTADVFLGTLLSYNNCTQIYQVLLFRFERDPDVFVRAQTRLMSAYEKAQASKLVMTSRPPPDFENADSWDWDDCKSDDPSPATYERLAWIYMRQLRGEDIPMPEAVCILSDFYVSILFFP